MKENIIKKTSASLIKPLMALALPIALQNVIIFSLNMLDSVMLGQLGEREIAAAGQANQPFFVFMLLLFGISSGACILTSQYYSRGDFRAVRKICALALTISTVFTTLIVIGVMLFPEKIMGFYADDPEIIALGTRYLLYVAPSYLFTAFSTIFLGIIVTVDEPALPLKINGFALICNSILNYLLIFGKLGFPAMGMEGAGLATLLARMMEFGIVIIYIARFDKKIKLRIHDFFHPSVTLVKDFIRYCTPVICNEFLWGLGISMYSVVIGRLEFYIISAYNIVTILTRISMSLTYGVCKASSIVVGKELGIGREENAYLYAKALLWISFICGLFSSFLLFLGLFAIPRVIQVSKEGMEAIVVILAIEMVATIFNSLNTTIVVGVLRSGGDTVWSLFLDVGFIWGLSLPVCALFAYLHFPLWAIIAATKLEEMAKLMFGLMRFASKKWIHNVTRENY